MTLKYCEPVTLNDAFATIHSQHCSISFIQKMPAFCSKMRCIGYVTEPAPKKPRVKKVLTDAEKDEAALKRNVNKLLRENKKEWESTLKPWVGSESTRWPVGTLVSFVFWEWCGE
jgi:hypothetical protein